jgi:hypothetical protein
MQKILFVLVCLGLSKSILFAQIEDTFEVNNLQGERAILFNFNNLTLNSFDGGIGYKYWSSDQNAFLGKLKFMMANNKKDKTESLMGEENYDLSIGFDLGFENHFGKYKDISPYIGVAVGAAFNKVSRKTILDERTYEFMFPPQPKNEVKTESVTFGLELFFGIEYFINKNISFAGQYNIGTLYKFGEEKIVSNTVDDIRDINKFSIGISSSSIILAIYF